MLGLSSTQQEISGLVIEDAIKPEKTTSTDWKPNTLSSRNNLLSTKTFTYLPNVTHIIIKTYDQFQKGQCQKVQSFDEEGRIVERRWRVGL